MQNIVQVIEYLEGLIRRSVSTTNYIFFVIYLNLLPKSFVTTLKITSSGELYSDLSQ